MVKLEGELTFDINSGKFWIMKEGNIVTSLEFGDHFEVLYNDQWIETFLKIDNDSDGNLIFTLPGTAYSGMLDGIPARF